MDFSNSLFEEIKIKKNNFFKKNSSNLNKKNQELKCLETNSCDKIDAKKIEKEESNFEIQKNNDIDNNFRENTVLDPEKKKKILLDFELKQKKNDRYKNQLKQELVFFQDPSSLYIYLNEISEINEDEKNICIKIRVFLKKLIYFWENKLYDLTDLNISAENLKESEILKETKQNLVLLLYKLRAQKLSQKILISLATIIHFIQNKNYTKANESYLKLSIGNVAWPIGLENIGIHLRKISNRTSSSSSSSNIMINEKTKLWILSIKRLISMSERLSFEFEKPNIDK